MGVSFGHSRLFGEISEGTPMGTRLSSGVLVGFRSHAYNARRSIAFPSKAQESARRDEVDGSSRNRGIGVRGLWRKYEQ